MSSYLKREAVRIVARCVYSIEGVRFAWRDEPSFQQWVVANVISITLACLIEMSTAERALIIALGLLVLVAELLNTGIEATIDRISEEHHPLSKKAKDTACAAVALTAITAGIVWLIVLIG